MQDGNKEEDEESKDSNLTPCLPEEKQIYISRNVSLNLTILKTDYVEKYDVLRKKVNNDRRITLYIETGKRRRKEKKERKKEEKKEETITT